MRVPAILAISLVAVLAGSLLLASPFSITSIIPKQNGQVQQAEAQAVPLNIRDRFAELQMAGDAEAGSHFLQVEEEFVDPENHCEFCTRIEYTPGPQGRAGFSYEDAAGLDLSNARKASFWVMGEEGDEKIKFKLAGKSLDRLQGQLQDRLGRLSNNIFQNERFALTTQEVTLENTWNKYEVDLTGVDLREITHPFAFELSEDAGTQVVYIKGVVYDDEPAVDPLAATAEDLIDPLAAEVISNATEGVVPATFEFGANVTGGTEPYSMTWDFDDGSEDEGQNVVHTFAEAGEYNVTMAVSDAIGQNASGSVVVQVAESEVVQDNSTLTDTNATGLQEETNSTSALGETNSTDILDEAPAEPIEIQVDAGIDIVAQPGDTVALAGEITGADELDGIDIEWTQTSAPEAELSDADSLNPTIDIPDLEDDAEIELEVAASLGSAEGSDSVTVFVEQVDEVEDAQEELLDPVNSVIDEWSDECEDLADCMSDGSGDTFAVASPENAGDVNLFSFEEFDVENAEIAYVAAMATARSDETGYLLFVGADADDAEDQSEPNGAVSIISDSFDEYEFVWEENPVNNEPWTIESLNSFLTGYAYGDGVSGIEVSEFSLIVTYTVDEPEEAALEAETSDETESDGTEQDTVVNEQGESQSEEENQESEPESESDPEQDSEVLAESESEPLEGQNDPEATNSTSE